MNTQAIGQIPGTLEAEFAVLSAHLRMCRRQHGDLLALLIKIGSSMA